MDRKSPPVYGESSALLSQAREWSTGEVIEKASCVLECCRVVLANFSLAGHEEQLECLRWMAELAKFVPVFELETDLMKPFLSSVYRYLGEIIEVFDDAAEDAKGELICLVRILLKLTNEVVNHVSDGNNSRHSEMPSMSELLPLIQLETRKKFFSECLKLRSLNGIKELKETLDLLGRKVE